MTISRSVVAVAYAPSSSKAVKVCVTKKSVVRAASASDTCPRKTSKKAVSP